MDKSVEYFWMLITDSGMLSAFFLMLETVLISGLLISFYFSLLYALIWCVKRVFRKRMYVQVNYYCWYALFVSIILANLEVNNNFKMLLFQALFGAEPYTPYLYLTSCVLGTAWLLTVACKLMVHIMLNRKIRKSLRYMERCEVCEHLREQVIKALGLRGKIAIMVADFIDSPVSYGIFKKTILLPWNYRQKYSDNELYLLLLHEAAHIKNGDTVKLRLINIAECFLWLTPAIRLFHKSFKRDAEILCDNRVMSVHSDRDTYGDLLLKECSDKNTVMGLGFSDSYRSLENRLDALYRFKPEKRNLAAIAAVIATALLLISIGLYHTRTDQLIINSGYNSEFEIVLSDAEFTNFEVLEKGLCGEIYEIKNNQIYTDRLALGELVNTYAGKGYELVHISSDNFILKINEFTLSSTNGGSFSFDELVYTDDSNRYSINRLEKRHPVEYLFLLIASKL